VGSCANRLFSPECFQEAVEKRVEIRVLLAQRIYSIELIEELAAQARHRLHRQGHANVEVRIGNGCRGWPERAPFDKVIVTAAPELIPPSLIYQLKPGGRMVIPAGLPGEQQLILLEKDAGGSVSTREIFAVMFSLLDDTEGC